MKYYLVIILRSTAMLINKIYCTLSSEDFSSTFSHPRPFLYIVISDIVYNSKVRMSTNAILYFPANHSHYRYFYV